MKSSGNKSSIFLLTDSAEAEGRYNSYYSGEHKKHVFGEGFLCTECHGSTSALSVSHFTNLNTPAVSGAAATIIPAANYTGKNCSITCHECNKLLDNDMINTRPGSPNPASSFFRGCTP